MKERERMRHFLRQLQIDPAPTYLAYQERERRKGSATSLIQLLIEPTPTYLIYQDD